MPFFRYPGPLVSLLFWGLIVSIISFGYQWFEKKGAEGDQINAGQSVKFKKAFDGHFYILARSENAEIIRFLFDTGASDIVLSPKDAQRLGFDLKSLSYDKSYHTSNGVIRAASVVIPSLKIGNRVIKHINASISSVQAPYSLMGMSFIENFAFTLNEDSLTLSFD